MTIILSLHLIMVLWAQNGDWNKEQVQYYYTYIFYVIIQWCIIQSNFIFHIIDANVSREYVPFCSTPPPLMHPLPHPFIHFFFFMSAIILFYKYILYILLI